jgi:hypothetical protein
MFRRRAAALGIVALLVLLAAAGPSCRKKEAHPAGFKSMTPLPTRLPKRIMAITPPPPPPRQSNSAPHVPDRQPTLVPTDPG